MSGVPRFYSYRHHVSPAAPELHKRFIRKFLGRNEVQNCPIFFVEFVILEFLIHLTWFCLWFAHSTICLYFCSVCLSSVNLCFNFFGPTTRAISVLSREDTVHNIDQPSQWERETRLNAPELVSKTHTKPGQGTVCSFLDSGACLILTTLASCIFHPYQPYLQKERETGVLSNISVLCWGDTVHDIDQPRLHLLQTQAYPQYPLCPLRYWPVSMLPTSFSSDAITPTVPIAPTTVPMPSTISTHLNGPVAIFFETCAYILFLYNTHNNGLCVVCIIDLSQVCQYIICNALIINTTSNVIKYLRLILILHSRGTFQENNW